MTVKPGFWAQKVMADKVGKCQFLRKRFPHLKIEATVVRLSSQFWNYEWKDSNKNSLND